MRIRLEKAGPHTCLPLPSAAAESPGFAAGEEVEVIWDPTRSQLLVRAALRSASAAPQVEADISRSVEEFLTQYTEALTELASL